MPLTGLVIAIVGGVVLSNNLHVWMADTQTPQSHADWLATLRSIQALKPRAIVPGHMLPGSSTALQSVTFTQEYIRAFDVEAAKAKDAAALIAAMKARYPQAGQESSLEIGARTGTFRLGGDELLVGADGRSRISFADFAIALIDELERPQHSRQRFTVGY